MEKIYTIRQLKDLIKDCNDNDELVIEIHEGIRSENLYVATFDKIDGIVNFEGQFISEIRLCI